MRRRSADYRELVWLAGLLAPLLLPHNGVAQTAVSSPAPDGRAAVGTGIPAGDVAALAEQIAVLRAVKPLQLTTDQLAALTQAAAGAQQRLAQQSQADARALAALREPITRARQQLLTAGGNPDDPQRASALMADQQVEAARRAAGQNQDRVQNELTDSLRRQLQTLLTPAQLSALVAQGQGMIMGERLQQDRQREQNRQQWQQAAARAGAAGGAAAGAAGNGRPGRWGGPGGSSDRSQGMLDRLRGATADDYQRMSRGMARRFGDEGTPGYQNALAMLDRVRSMPDAQFRRQGARLAQQFGAAMTAPQSAASAATTISADHALDTWIQRYLLSQQAPDALKELVAARGEQQRPQ